MGALVPIPRKGLSASSAMRIVLFVPNCSGTEVVVPTKLLEVASEFPVSSQEDVWASTVVAILRAQANAKAAHVCDFLVFRVVVFIMMCFLRGTSIFYFFRAAADLDAKPINIMQNNYAANIRGSLFLPFSRHTSRPCEVH